MPMQYSYSKELLLHNLNQPLAVIRLNTDLALEELKPNDYFVKRCLERIVGSCFYINKLLSELRIDHNSNFELKTALRGAVKINSKHNKCSIFSYHENLSFNPSIKGNKFVFQQIIIALINNALESYRVNDFKKIVLISSVCLKDEVQIAISDGGVGLNWWQRQLVFKKGFTLKEKHSGLGLYLCQKIIKEDFHGKIKLISQKNKGCTVQCFFPILALSKQ